MKVLESPAKSPGAADELAEDQGSVFEIVGRPQGQRPLLSGLVLIQLTAQMHYGLDVGDGVRRLSDWWRAKPQA